MGATKKWPRKRKRVARTVHKDRVVPTVRRDRVVRPGLLDGRVAVEKSDDRVGEDQAARQVQNRIIAFSKSWKPTSRTCISNSTYSCAGFRHCN